MATAVEHRSQAHLGGMSYDPMRYNSPQFTNPWAGSNGAMYHHHHQQQQQPQQHHHHHHQATTMSSPQHHDQRASPMAAAYAPSHAAAPVQPALAQDMMLQQQQQQQAQQQQPRAYDNTYVSAPPAPNPYLATTATTSAPRYSPEQYSAVPSFYDAQDRRHSYQIKTEQSARAGFNDGAAAAALDASRGMVAMSQDITPRNIYGPRNGSHDSYGFPPAHSTASSVSSGSGYPYNHYGSSYQGSVDGASVTDYSSASEEMNPRTLPVPGPAALGTYPPEPQSMMTQFNSKLSPSAQKKHKCKICDKRFTRPSSLQTHMYSHTGEKPFECDFPGCGRHFSVVSNLRRHKKCHKTAGSNDTGSVKDDEE